MSLKNINKYLPSKQFQKIFGFILILIIIGFSIFFLFNRKEKFDTKNKLALQDKTVLDITKTDTDGDGLFDWEESLWGTDKNNKFTFGEMSDSQYVENKRKDLNINKEINEKELNETDLFAREFFASYIALKGTEGVDNEMIQNFSKSLGEKISESTLENKYFKSDVKINTTDNLNTRDAYYSKISNLFDKYKESGLGDELNIINRGLINYTEKGEEVNYSELLIIGEAYQEFASKMMEVPVPKTLADYHLEIANNANNTGVSVTKISKVIDNPIVGVSAFSSYQKYSQDLINSVNTLQKVIDAKLE